MSIEGIPDGWELVRVGKPTLEEFIIGHDGSPVACVSLKRPLRQFRYAVIRKIEKPKQYRAFANAAEFEPHRDRWIKRSSKHDTSETLPAGCFKVAGYNDHHYWTDGGRCTSYEAAFYDGKCFEDGTPFGVEVTE